ncbi:MAG: Fur family transcriptional regulator [Armatimonadota bacterium]
MRASSVDQAILETLAREHAHLSSLQVFEAIRERLPALNPSTVYRALERLTKQGRVSVSDMGTGAAVYELVEEGLHHHLVCQQCGRVKRLRHEAVQGLYAEVQEKYGFRVVTNHLVLFGLCETCSGSTRV